MCAAHVIDGDALVITRVGAARLRHDEQLVGHARAVAVLDRITVVQPRDVERSTSVEDALVTDDGRRQQTATRGNVAQGGRTCEETECVTTRTA